jgi:hypothetical protein
VTDRSFERSLGVLRKALTILAVATAVSLAMAGSAHACSCAADPDEKETLRGFDAAATMRLTDVRNEDPQNGSADLEYRVLRVYKGSTLEEGESFVMKNVQQGSACGLPRDEGERYGLRLYRTHSGLRSSLCVLLSPKELRRAAQRSGNARSASRAGCGSAS